MRYPELLLIGFLLLGCSGEQMAHGITKVQIAMAGNKPPAFFKIANLKTMRGYVFNMKHYTIALPEAKTSDFTGLDAYSNKKAWRGATYYGKDITLYLEGYYHIDISTDYYPQKVGEYQKAILNKDLNYFKEFFKRSKFKKMYFAHLGKESYPCLVTEYKKEGKYYKNSKYMGVSCYKFNPTKTKYQSVRIRLTYSKPLDPKLTKIYTYQDLKRRAKRTLDSLYIKSWW